VLKVVSMDSNTGTKTVSRRVHSVDLLRGIVMMIMLLDHVREFVHAGAMRSDPTDLATTTAAIFFTRWITHFCAPIFVFLSGVSIYLQLINGKPKAGLSRFLWTRGLWLIFLEFTVVRFGTVFNLDYSYFGMAQVIWVIGVSMIVMAALVYAPVKLVGMAGLLMIVLHNLFDGFQVPPNVSFAGAPPPDLGQTLWIILHQPGIVPIFGGASKIFFGYPLIPWIGVMMLGYAVGSIYAWEPNARRKALLYGGVAATVLFAVLRFANVYGDPQRWTTRDAFIREATQGAPAQPGRPQPDPESATSAYTLLSFLNTTKYPPSLLFLLMTLGPGLIVLSLTDAIAGETVWQRVPITFGRVPMFYYILQWFTAHGFGLLLGYLAGVDVGYLFRGLLEMGQAAPPDHGFSLGVTYLVWLAGLIVLYPLCKWWGDLKRRNKHWALSYL
jgi:uncharacterized membrane protein